MEPITTYPRRKFLKTMWGGAVVLGGGMLGFSLGACSSDGRKPTPGDVRDLDLASLPELSPREVEEFIRDTERDSADYRRREDSAAGASDAPATGDAGPDRPRLPPGQRLVQALIVFGRNPNPRPLADFSFYVRGEVENELSFTWNEFLALPRVTRTVDVHCVTTWSVFDLAFRGILVSELLARARLTDRARFVVFDCELGYTTNIGLAEAQKNNVLIANQLGAEALPQVHGGPARGLVPNRYFYKSGKWCVGLRVLAEDEPGYWETRGYSNTADPWREERLS